MLVAELLMALAKMPHDEQVFLRFYDSDDEPMYTLVGKVTAKSEGIVVTAGEEIRFGEDD